MYTNDQDGSDSKPTTRRSLASLPSIDIDSDATQPSTTSDMTQPMGAADNTSTDDTASATYSEQTIPMPIDDQPTDVEDDRHAMVEAALDSLVTGDQVSRGVQSYGTPFSATEASMPLREGPNVAKRVLLTLLAIIGVLGVVYLVGGLYFSSHFLPHTTVNGEDVSGMSIEDLSSYVSDIGKHYRAHVSGDGLDLTIAGTDIDFVYDGDAYGKEAGAQIANWSWPIELNRPHDYVVAKGISFDDEKLQGIIQATVLAINETASQPTNATMAYDSSSGTFAVVSESLGTAVSSDAVHIVVSEGVGTLQDEIVVGDEQLVQPSITKKDETLQANIDRANKLVQSTVSLKIAGTNALDIDKNLLASWISMDEVCNLAFNVDAIRGWAQGELSERFDTTGTKRTYTRPDGKKVEVEGSAPEYDYGWSLDGEALANIIADNLANNVTDAIDVPMKKSAATWNPGGQEWPKRYIDVDLNEQHVRMYDDNSNIIWETDCVSGNPIYSGGTDTGVYYIYRKASPEVLEGLDYDGDGQPDYRTDVTFWMPFDGGEGLHDAGWRGGFGGNIYTYDGSHGCVNLPYAAAQQLYEISNVGDVVVVHW